MLSMLSSSFPAEAFQRNMEAMIVPHHKPDILNSEHRLHSLPGRHHVWEPDPAQVLRHLPVNLIQGVFVIWNQYLLHDGQLGQSAAAHFNELHKRAAGHFALTQADGWQLGAVFGDTDQLLIQRTQAVGAHDQLHQTRAVEAHSAQDLFAHWAPEVKVCDRDFLIKEGPELVLIEEEVHDQVKFGRVPHHSVPAALLDGVEVLPGVFAHHINSQVFQVDVLLRGERQQEFITQEVVV